MRMRLKRMGPFIYRGCLKHTTKDRQNNSDPGSVFSQANHSNMPYDSLSKANHPSGPLNSCGKTPSLAPQLLIDSKKLVGSLRS